MVHCAPKSQLKFAFFISSLRCTYLGRHKSSPSSCCSKMRSCCCCCFCCCCTWQIWKEMAKWQEQQSHGPHKAKGVEVGTHSHWVSYVCGPSASNGTRIHYSSSRAKAGCSLLKLNKNKTTKTNPPFCSGKVYNKEEGMHVMVKLID